MGSDQDSSFELNEGSTEENRVHGWTALHQSDSEPPKYATGLRLSDGKKISIFHFREWSNLAIAIQLGAIKINEIITQTDSAHEDVETIEDQSGYFDFSYAHLNESSADFLSESSNSNLILDSTIDEVVSQENSYQNEINNSESLGDSQYLGYTNLNEDSTDNLPEISNEVLISNSSTNEIAPNSCLNQAVEEKQLSTYSTTWKERLHKFLLILASLTSLSALGMGVSCLVGLAVGWPVMVGISSLIGTVALYIIASVFIGQAICGLGLALLNRFQSVKMLFAEISDDQISANKNCEQIPQNLIVSSSITKPDELPLVKRVKVHTNPLAAVPEHSSYSEDTSSYTNQI